MAGFLYYIPGIDKADHDVLYKHGLAYAFSELKGNPTVNRVIGGPDDGDGVVIPGIGCTDHRYKKDAQTWRKYKGIYVGYWNEQKPGPSDLQRADALNGHKVTLGDGNQWIVPVARQINDVDGRITASCALPSRIGWDEDGAWVMGDVVQKYFELWNTAQAFWDQLTEQTPGDLNQDKAIITFDFAGGNDAAVMVLQCNYHISPREIDLLELFDIDSAGNVLRALVDWPSFLDCLQKKRNELTVDG